MTRTIISFILSSVFFCIGYPNSVAARDLIAGVSHIPPHAEVGKDGRPKGGFVDLIKAIDSVYTEGEIFIKVLPVKRAKMLLINGIVDFLFPAIYMPEIPKEMPVAFVSERVVDVAFVLYTRADMKMLPMNELGGFHIEIIRGANILYPFKVSEIDSTSQGILRVSYGRSDGFISQQDATDRFIRENKIKNIRRTLYANLKSVIMIREGAESEELDRILSSSLRILKQKDELQRITDTIHRPFEDWQPYLMDWSDTK